MPKAEDTWLAGARALDREILTEIYDQLHPELYRYAFRLIGTHEQALDIVSEVFARLLQKLRAGGGPAENIRAYLYRMVHNLTMDRFREDRYLNREANPDQLLAGDESDPLRMAQQRSDTELARQALWELTAEQRQVIILRFLENLTPQEIAIIIDKPQGAVRALQYRGLKAMRHFMEQLSTKGNDHEA